MTACLTDRELFALSEGAGDRDARAHAERCRLCAYRARQLERDLAMLGRVLAEPCPPDVVTARPRVRAFAPAAAIAALLVLGLVGLRAAPWRRADKPRAATDGVAALADLSARAFGEDLFGEDPSQSEAVSDADAIAVAFDTAGPCEWQPGGCEDEDEPLF